MSILEKDLIRRLIQNFAQVLARLVGLRTSGQLEQAESELRETTDKLLGPWARDAELLAADSLSKLLSGERLTLYAELLAERAHLHAARGRMAEARADRQRALSLMQALEVSPRTSTARAQEPQTPALEPIAASEPITAPEPTTAQEQASRRRQTMAELRELLKS